MNERQGPPAELKARLLAAAARQPATPPGAWGRRRAVTVGAGVLWLGVLLLVCGVRRDWSELPAAPWAVTVLGLVSAAAVATGLALQRGRTMVGVGAGPLSAALCALPLVLGLLVTVLDPRGASTATGALTAPPPHAPSGLLRGTIGCVEITLVAGLPLIALGLSLLRGLTVSRPVAVGACLGLGAATWAHALVRVHCAMGGIGHALVAHLLPALPLMALSAWALWAMDRRALAPRRPPPDK